MSENKNQRRLPTQFMLLAKGAIGAYLIYTAWQLYQNVLGGREEHAGLLVAFLVFFALAGAAILVWSVKDLAQGRYLGGKLDLGSGEEEEFTECTETEEEA